MSKDPPLDIFPVRYFLKSVKMYPVGSSGSQGRHLGVGRGGLPPTLTLKNSDFCVFAHKMFFFFIFCPPPRKSVKILPPHLERNWNDVPGGSWTSNLSVLLAGKHLNTASVQPHWFYLPSTGDGWCSLIIIKFVHKINLVLFDYLLLVDCRRFQAAHCFDFGRRGSLDGILGTWTCDINRY